jgi:hypothetical protein
MKKITLLIVMLCSIAMAAQDYPGKAIEMLDGKELKVKKLLTPTSIERGYRGFYTDAKYQKIYKKKGFGTDIKALEGKVFKVVSYVKDMGQYTVTLQNNEIGTLYYRYDPTYDREYNFEVIGGLTFPPGFFCDKLLSDRQWISSQAAYIYTAKTPSKNDLSVVESGDGYIFDALLTTDSDSNEARQGGVTLYLANGKEVSWPDVRVEAEVSGKSFNYKAQPVLTAAQIVLLKESPIVRKKIGAIEQPVEKGDMLREYIKCLCKK